MARYHYQSRRDAERQYQHRVDVPVPEGGLGERLNQMHRWCREHVAAGGWAQHGVTDRTMRDGRGIPVDVARFYFAGAADAASFRNRWVAGD